MSTHVLALIPATDPTYQKHLKVWVACKEAEVSLPKETLEYLEGCDHIEQKLEVEIKVIENGDDSRNIWEVYIKDIPKGTEKIQFINSY